MAPILGIISSSITANLVTNDFYSIATVDVTSATGSITFSSIPSTYTHLQIRASYLNSLNLYSVKIQFNGDTGSNYNEFQLSGNGSSASASASTSTGGLIGIGAINTSLYSGALVCDILDYNSTNKLKTVRSISGADGNGSGQVKLNGPLWRSTSAITSITVYNDGSNFNQYSKFALYGIKA